ncbi:unknown protein [Seminavis robusta]|uniref:Uncharacterized protein n=1 Tax=Seminavis robusta TaxID=568900 RepID=A0A9N8E503_9STRA|nr:unknown protein [Seminavis robusta]|eukprot:Sro507_g156510.1 n/a (398) ;mRNA; f:24413-25731
MTNRRLGKGVKVMIKSGNVPAIIKEAAGEKTWLVFPVDETGKTINPDGSGRVLKSQQLRHLKAGETFPEPQEQPGKPKATSTRQPKKKKPTTTETEPPKKAAAKAPSTEASDPTASTIEVSPQPRPSAAKKSSPAEVQPPPVVVVDSPNEPPAASSPPKQQVVVEDVDSESESDDDELFLAGVHRRRAKLAARKAEESNKASLKSSDNEVEVIQSSDDGSVQSAKSSDNEGEVIQPSDHGSVQSGSTTSSFQSQKQASVQSSNNSFVHGSVGSNNSSLPNNVETSGSEDSGDVCEPTDQRMSEDFPQHNGVDLVDEDGQPVLDPNDLLIIEGMEDEDKYAKKWREYEEEKARLLREGWTVERKPPMSQAIYKDSIHILDSHTRYATHDLEACGRFPS